MFRDKSCRSDKRKVNKSENWIFRKDKTDDDFGKMVVVGDWNTYYAVRGIIEDALVSITGGDRETSDPQKVTLERIEKENFYDFIIRQIAVFKPVEITD